MIIPLMKMHKAKEELFINYFNLMQNFGFKQYAYVANPTLDNHIALKSAYSSIVDFEIQTESIHKKHFDSIINQNILETYAFICRTYKCENSKSDLNFLIGEILDQRSDGEIEYYKVGINTNKISGLTIFENHYTNSWYNRLEIGNSVFDIYDLEKEIRKDELALLYY